MNIAEHIKNYRKENNITQQELANRLFVTKQTISKWELNKSLPDISLYPILSEMLKVSVDELMGIDYNSDNEIQVLDNNIKNKKANYEKKKTFKIIIPFSIALISCLIVIVVLLTIKTPTIVLRQYHIHETEEILDVKLPKITTYEYKNLSNWAMYNNFQYPLEMYYFIFENQNGMTFVNDGFVKKLDEKIIELLPESLHNYFNTCDYFKLVNKKTLEINQIPNPFDSEKEEYILYCVQLSTKRLIVVNFEI